MNIKATALTALAAVGVLAAAIPSAQALTIYVDQDATWRYVNATSATTQAVPGNWYTTGFDDSGWFTGSAPFTSSPSNPPSTFGPDQGNVTGPWGGGPADPIPSSGTLWDSQGGAFAGDPYLRIHFNLDAPTALTIWLAIDNGINSMYLNGIQAVTSSISAEGQGFRWENVFDVNSAFTVAGDNVLAIQLEDHGGATAFDLMVTGDDAATNTTFTAVPEPVAATLWGAGLLGLGFVRRRARRS